MAHLEPHIHISSDDFQRITKDGSLCDENGQLDPENFERVFRDELEAFMLGKIAKALDESFANEQTAFDALLQGIKLLLIKGSESRFESTKSTRKSSSLQETENTTKILLDELQSLRKEVKDVHSEILSLKHQDCETKPQSKNMNDPVTRRSISFSEKWEQHNGHNGQKHQEGDCFEKQGMDNSSRHTLSSGGAKQFKSVLKSAVNSGEKLLHSRATTKRTQSDPNEISSYKKADITQFKEQRCVMPVGSIVSKTSVIFKSELIQDSSFCLEPTDSSSTKNQENDESRKVSQLDNALSAAQSSSDMELNTNQSVTNESMGENSAVSESETTRKKLDRNVSQLVSYHSNKKEEDLLTSQSYRPDDIHKRVLEVSHHPSRISTNSPELNHYPGDSKMCDKQQAMNFESCSPEISVDTQV